MRILFVLLTSLTVLCHGYSLFDTNKRPLLSFLVGSKHVPSCLLSCTENLKQELMKFVYGNITMDSHDEICSAFSEASSCVVDSRECDDYQIVFRKLTSGFKWACEDGGSDQFKNLIPCILKVGQEAREEYNCADVCEINNDTMVPIPPDDDYNTNNDNVITHLSNFCRPLACYLNCTREQLNTVCPTFGSKLIHVPASAFDELVDEYILTTVSEKKQIMKKVPPSCRLFFKEREVTALRFDERFIRDMFFMMTSRKQRTRNGGYTTSEIDKIVKDLLSKMENEEKPPKVLKWDAWKILILFGIGLVFILNIVGLVFTVYWCLNEKELAGNNGNSNDNELSANHFVEPNIRMKLKLPRMRSDAIEDSSQEFMQLRIPRNGNQFARDEQQTVVVPRWKRRRTFSVPLEPRSRINSTGSDKFPDIVILRSHEN
ncbi:unnamed protein product [Caenorhabditis bovis]|uniref:Chondroitin proteoglycan 4 domain-containing protein n=1 Tax=Caenorhabditis bovis TaxID=2654633 RepID=A0A8S1EW51_9PELO|nr:unnamed protein product [Caenorhabditis bovis]